MRFTTREVNGVIIIDIEGKILLGDGDEEIRQEVARLLKGGNKFIILNLAKIPYIDSMGLAALIYSYTATRKNQGRLVLLNPNQCLVDLLSITKLKSVFDCYDTEKDAITGVKER